MIDIDALCLNRCDSWYIIDVTVASIDLQTITSQLHLDGGKKCGNYAIDASGRSIGQQPRRNFAASQGNQ
jgi:hypothetical protein